MTSRKQQAHAFITKHNWGEAAQSVLAGDASNRRYDRLVRQDGTTAVFMDAPADKGEDVHPFIAIANWLVKTGLSAPNILAQDTDLGFLLIEDLGDDLFARHALSHPRDETMLYAEAVDVLTYIHAAKPPPLLTYTASVMTSLAALAFDWYQMGATGSVDHDARNRFIAVFGPLLTTLDHQKPVLIQRDYHAENLLWLPQRHGPARVGLLDFQDAMLGHPAYDLVSILQDARRDVSSALETEMIARYIAQNTIPADEFHLAYALLGVQRNLRILGVFARLCMRDGKAHYVDLIPRVWGHLQTNLAKPTLQKIAPLLASALPPPTSDVLERLKSQCATHPTR